MTNVLSLNKASNLVMPKHYIELDREEMIYIDGGDYYISNNACSTIVGIVCGGLYFGGVGLATAIMCGFVTKAAISGLFASIVSTVTAVNVVLGGLLAVIGEFVLEVFVNMCIAVGRGESVVIETLKIWKWDTGIPMGVGTCK